MDFTEDFIKENELTESQVTALTSAINENEANLKKTWDGVANENAEKILNGAATKIFDTTKIERHSGEKMGDYIARVQLESFSSKELEYNNKMKELEEKMKTAGSDETLKGEYDTLKTNYSELQKKEAAFDELLNSGVKDKYDNLLESNNQLNLEVSFNSVKPNFPETVNAYEAKAKWSDFKSGVLDKYHVKIVENEAIAIDKDNEHKVIKLKDLLDKDAEISRLLEGRKQDGLNGKPIVTGKIEGVPFDVPITAKSDAKVRASVIREHLSKEGVGNTDPKYSKLFTEFNNKIMGQQTA
jgi:hypothetical protein